MMGIIVYWRLYSHQTNG